MDTREAVARAIDVTCSNYKIDQIGDSETYVLWRPVFAEVVKVDSYAECAEELQHLCADAAIAAHLKALAAEGYVVVPREPGLMEVARGFCCDGGKCGNAEDGRACVADRFLWSARNAIAQEGR